LSSVKRAVIVSFGPTAGVIRLEEARTYFVAPQERPVGLRAFLGPLELIWDEAEKATGTP